MKVYPTRTLSLTLELFQCATTLKQCVDAHNIVCMYTHCTSVGTRNNICVYTQHCSTLVTTLEQTMNRNKARTMVTPPPYVLLYHVQYVHSGGDIQISPMFTIDTPSKV